MSRFYNDSIFWIEVDKIKPNPYQPRRHFDEVQLKSLADSIRQYGVLQALVVTRSEVEREDGGIGVEYELVAGGGGGRPPPPPPPRPPPGGAPPPRGTSTHKQAKRRH